jgi:hypothetical protein
MFKKKDPYTFTKFSTLFNGVDSSNQPIAIGSICADYEVTSYDDVQVVDLNSVIKRTNKKFLLHCTQKINIFNPSGMAPSLDSNFTSYNNYPAMINTLLSLIPAQGLDFQLLDYSPQTINTKIQSSGSSGASNGQTSGILKQQEEKIICCQSHFAIRIMLLLTIMIICSLVSIRFK